MLSSFAALAVLASQSASQPAAACENRVERAHFSVCYNDAVPETAALWLADRVEVAYHLVQTYLADVQTYAGPPYDTPMVVHIDPDRPVPFQRGPNYYVPQARALAAFEGRTDVRSDIAIVHEVVHVLAASAYRQDRNRFYDDGLAVFLDHRFGMEASYPNYGEDLYIATARAAHEHGGLIPLEEAERVRRAQESRISRRLAYLQEGAFTQYLIERFGLNDYFRIYHGEEIETVTGHSLAELEADWIVLIEATGRLIEDD